MNDTLNPFSVGAVVMSLIALATAIWRGYDNRQTKRLEAEFALRHDEQQQQHAENLRRIELQEKTIEVLQQQITECYDDRQRIQAELNELRAEVRTKKPRG